MHESPRPKTAKENMDSFRRRYGTEIRPLIDKEGYRLAWAKLNEYVAYFNMRQDEILHTVHSGPACLASLNLLFNALETGDTQKIFSNKEKFEMFLAQTALPLGD